MNHVYFRSCITTRSLTTIRQQKIPPTQRSNCRIMHQPGSRTLQKFLDNNRFLQQQARSKLCPVDVESDHANHNDQIQMNIKRFRFASPCVRQKESSGPTELEHWRFQKLRRIIKQ
ncbi:hypothetical protein EUGRSUZ_J01246 [Eucalyptus grandis]|uniref:Uncharacterized protein n=2 Tax=Eucalyptus grandis TaxID=71139 RepID=A0ACC3J5M0_EUCGR|nr:hypothetical protein EUGRSUZ_J01246 [Eucalyptus grandis]